MPNISQKQKVSGSQNISFHPYISKTVRRFHDVFLIFGRCKGGAQIISWSDSYYHDEEGNFYG